MKPKNYTEKSLKCDWTDKKNCLIHYWMLKVYVRRGMIVDKGIGIFPLIRIMWREKNMSFNTQKRNQAMKDLEKDFYELLNNAVYGKTMEHVRDKEKRKVLKKVKIKNIEI